MVEAGVRIVRWRGTAFPGEVFVFLHGLGDGADVWRPVIKAWPGAPITAIAVDFPGHGGTDFCSEKDYTVPKFAHWLAEVLSRNGVRNPVLVGHSMGGRVALEVASTGAVQPAHVAVVDVSPDPKESSDIDTVIQKHLDMLIAGAPSLTSFRQKVAAQLPLADKEALTEIVPALVEAGQQNDTPGARLRLDPKIGHLLNAPYEVNGWAALEALGCPTTIIRGAFSSALDAATAQKMSQTLRHPAGCITIPKAGHAIAFEQPVALAQAIVQSMRDHS